MLSLIIDCYCFMCFKRNAGMTYHGKLKRIYVSFCPSHWRVKKLHIIEVKMIYRFLIDQKLYRTLPVSNFIISV
jgi:hypothetical protein